MNVDYREVVQLAIQQTAEEMAKECTYAELVACAAQAREDRDFEMMRVFNKAITIQFNMALDLMVLKLEQTS